MRKQPIHTTLSKEAYSILERYEHELGNKSAVLEKALMGMDKTRYKSRLNLRDSQISMKRIKTGIKGFDELVEGGIPEGFVTIVTGPPGGGKTTFSMQFLLEGAEEKCRGMFFSFEEDADQIAKQFARFGWDIRKYVESGWMEIYGMSMLTIEEIIDIIETYKPKRVVFDSMNVFYETDNLRRSAAWRNLFKLLKQERITSLVVTEKANGMEVKNFDDYDFMGDGIVFLDKTIVGKTVTHNLSVLKMRGTNVDSSPQEYVFTEKGLELTGWVVS
ncbi:MAG: ATPase domain-containing protein [Halobacteriota archaeon]|nr:ATPase domain-containing protein [Halobacteriota archaeon]